MSHFTLDQMLEKSRAVNALEHLEGALVDKKELEAEVEHWKREAKANQLLLNRQRVEEAALKAAAKPKTKAPAKLKAQPKPKTSKR